MNRREMLAGGVALAAAAAAARAAEPAMHEHHHHHSSAPSEAANLAVAAADCQQKGQVCIDHCLVLLGEGDKAMAACAQSVSQMLSVCAALQRLANANSKHLPHMAHVALGVCRDCEAECKKHADKHVQCKDCMESCAACARLCEKMAA